MSKKPKIPPISLPYDYPVSNYCATLPTATVETLPPQTPYVQPLDKSQMQGNGQTIDTLLAAQASGLSMQKSMIDMHCYAINQRQKAAASAKNINDYVNKSNK